MQRPNYVHISLECQGCPKAVLDDSSKIIESLCSIAADCSLHIVKKDIHKFRPQGVTGYLLLKESHLSIHTWPENNFALVDVLSCSSVDIDTLRTSLYDALRPRSVTVTVHEENLA